jgi:hypothetical protein
MSNAVSIAQSGANNVTMRNRIINGGMVINQRATSVTDAGFITDRWQYTPSLASKATISQDTSVYPTGFNASLKVLSSSAYTVGASELFIVRQAIEGFNVADLGWGFAGAQPVTISFWVRSSLTGTFGGAVENLGIDRCYVFSYSIPAANTWTQITITIAGDTTGTWNTTNAVGIRVSFSLGTGSSYSGSAGSWGSTRYFSATGAVSVVGTNAATWYITGVQLEKGTTATPFEQRLYGTELALCQRYYSKSYLQTVVPGTASATGAPARFVDAVSNYASIQIFFPQSMRTTPTVTPYNPSTGTVNQIRTDSQNLSAAVSDPGPVGCFIHVTNAPVSYVSDSTRVHFTASAEL